MWNSLNQSSEDKEEEETITIESQAAARIQKQKNDKLKEKFATYKVH